MLHRQHKTILGEGIIHMGEEGVFGRRGRYDYYMLAQQYFIILELTI